MPTMSTTVCSGAHKADKRAGHCEMGPGRDVYPTSAAGLRT